MQQQSDQPPAKPSRSRDGDLQPITVSVVSHGQAALIKPLLGDLQAHCAASVKVVLTVNIPEDLPFSAESFDFPLIILRNERPKGFGANHNAAFLHCDSPYFCILNPDIRLDRNPFPALIAPLASGKAALAAPRIVAPDGTTEDSARRFPTPFVIARKLFGGARGPDYPEDLPLIEPDWVAGMFMLVSAPAFREIGGFDERYFLYYEDVDLCSRLRRRGQNVVQVTGVTAVHAARRASRRNFKYASWHLRSMARFFVNRYLRR